MGLAILHGKVPYADLFDHKGPMLYLIEAIGQWLIPGRYGLFLLAVMGLAISVFCWYKSARLFTTRLRSFVVIILTLFSYYFYSEYGNLSEDWNIPFISISYYLILSLLINGKSKNYLMNGAAVGLCLAGSFFIRPNDAVAFIGVPILGVIIWMLKERRFQIIYRWVGGVAIGFFTIAIVFIIWFAAYNALSDLWYGLVEFNSKYATGIRGLIMGCFKITKLGYAPFLVSLLILSYLVANKRPLYVLVPTVLAAYILLGNNAYLHYWIAWVPVVFFSYWVFACAQLKKSVTVLAICMFLSLPIFDNRNWLKMPYTIYKEVKRDFRLNDSTAFNTKDLFSDLKREDKDSIWSYNLTWHGETSESLKAFNVLLYNEIIPCNRVPLIFMAERDESLYESMDVVKAQPKFVLYSPCNNVPNTYITRDSLFIKENYLVIKESVNPKILLYKRKY